MSINSFVESFSYGILDEVVVLYTLSIESLDAYLISSSNVRSL